MTFDTGTWWLIGILLTILVGAVVFLVKVSIFGRLDEHDAAIAQCVKKDDYEKEHTELSDDIKQVRQDYTPRSVHSKDLDECRGDIKQIKADYITKEDFFREQGKTDRKLDRIMDILLEMKGDKKSE